MRKSLYSELKKIDLQRFMLGWKSILKVYAVKPYTVSYRTRIQSRVSVNKKAYLHNALTG
jgi:hypothetical protein